jgi:hypothetical protein
VNPFRKQSWPAHPRKFCPALEPLEDRLVPAVFNVTSLIDSNAVSSWAATTSSTPVRALPSS